MIIWKVLNLNFNDEFPMRCCEWLPCSFHGKCLTLSLCSCGCDCGWCFQFWFWSEVVAKWTCNANVPKKNRFFSIYFLWACVIIINNDVSIVQLHSRKTLYLLMQMIIYSAIFQKQRVNTLPNAWIDQISRNDFILKTHQNEHELNHEMIVFPLVHSHSPICGAENEMKK